MSRILTTHAGSLPRPQSLTRLLIRQFSGDGVDQAELDREVATAVDDVVQRQLEAGIDIVNNGEMGRESFFTYVQHRMSGFGDSCRRPIMADLTRYPGYLERITRTTTGESGNVSLLAPPCATGEVRYLDTDAIRSECKQLADTLARHGRAPASAFVSSPSPGIIAAAMENRHYDSLSDYVDALGKALAIEYRTILDAGFALQIDAPDLAMERHTLFQDKPLEEFQRFVGIVVGAINAALDAVDTKRVRLHVCWGNYEGAHDCDVALAEIWPELAKAHVGAFMLSMANPRHAHEYRLFRDGILPTDTTIIAGVIDTTTNYVEHPETVADRLERVVEAVGDPERVMAGTDCGFETSAGFTSVSPDICWAKLGAMVEGARLASERLA